MCVNAPVLAQVRRCTSYVRKCASAQVFSQVRKSARKCARADVRKWTKAHVQVLVVQSTIK